MSNAQTFIAYMAVTAVTVLFFWRELLSALLGGLLFVLRPIRDWIDRKKRELEDQIRRG